jgi:1,4-alpha-glucan branching enzyme
VYGGGNMGNGAVELIAEEKEWMGRPWSIVVTLPPLAGIVLVPEEKQEAKAKGKSTDVPTGNSTDVPTGKSKAKGGE